MKNILLITPLALGLATTALAGNLETPVIKPVAAVAASVTDWSGPYVGVAARCCGGGQKVQ